MMRLLKSKTLLISQVVAATITSKGVGRRRMSSQNLSTSDQQP
jgi:hypothetical protein